VLSFIVVFGVTKALTNYLAGRSPIRFGRKHVLVGGWLVAAPVPFLLMWAPSWAWVLFANALLGVSQGLTWSTTVIMKIDLAGPAKRGLAMGLNEFAGYFAVAGSALATGFIAAHYGLRPEPFYLGVGFVALGLALSALAVRETRSTTSPPRRSSTASCPPTETHSPARGLLAHHAARQEPVERQPGRPRQQPQRRHGVGPVPAVLRRRRMDLGRSARSRRSTPRPGASRSSSPARGPIASGASG
jgi:MFS family permease